MNIPFRANAGFNLNHARKEKFLWHRKKNPGATNHYMLEEPGLHDLSCLLGEDASLGLLASAVIILIVGGRAEEEGTGDCNSRNVASKLKASCHKYTKAGNSRASSRPRSNRRTKVTGIITVKYFK